MDYTNSLIRNRIDSAANWQANNPQILAGEICLNSDTNNRDFKVGTGNTWANTPYFIATNPAVVGANNNANTARSVAQNALSIAQSHTTMLNDVNEISTAGLIANYSTSDDIWSEDVASGISKQNLMEQWIVYIKSGMENSPTYRMTDAVSWDALFYVLAAMFKSGIIELNSEQMDEFYVYLSTMTSLFSNLQKSEERTKLDEIRINVNL